MADYQNYNDAVQTIKSAIVQSQYEAGRSVNASQLSLYYGIGRYVSANTRSGTWGSNALASISNQLQKELPGLRGFSERNLKYMRTFFEEWRDVIEPSLPVSASQKKDLSAITIRHLQVPNLDADTQGAFLSIGFTHHRIIPEKISDLDERLFYIKRCAREHLSVKSLKQSICRDDYRHQANLPNNFLETIPSARRALRAIESFKDEYLLDFINVEELGVRDASDIDERTVEQAIVNNVKNFIMTFGRGFSFIGNNYHLEAFGEDQFIDLLFFNRDLNCLVAVELKRGKFKPAYLGQLSAYLTVLDEFERRPHESPSIGIVLCKDMNEAFVNLVIQSYSSPMGVATYTVSADVLQNVRNALPDIDDFRAMLEDGGA